MERMKLKKLLSGISVEAVKGSKEVEITGICTSSASAHPGSLFIAKKGRTHDGTKFIPEAINAGSVAVVTDIYDPFLQNIVQIIHPNPAEIEPELLAAFYEKAAEKLFLVAVTGTNGKTTCAYLIRHLLEGMGKPCGLIGTIEKIVGKHHFPSTLTTSDLSTNYKLFYEMVSQGCTSAVMEVSSHALDQKRVYTLDFDAAIFTNLTQDHLDYHKTMEEYAAAKAKLFASLGSYSKSLKAKEPKIAILNADSPWAPRMAQECQVPILTYGLEKPADLMPKHIRLEPKGTECIMTYQGEEAFFACDLIGRFNVYNCLAALALGLSCGGNLKEMCHILNSFKAAPGRLQRVSDHIFVDYAHTDDALKNVLETLREIKKGRLILVFGCGGNRDMAKRPKMGKVAEELADAVIVTSDNPRLEDPTEIIAQVLKGFSDKSTACVEVDRKSAIEKAIRMAAPEDIVLIAGKGHENYQIFADKTIAFDDVAIAHEALSKNP